MIHTANEACENFNRIFEFLRIDRERIVSNGDRSGSVRTLHEHAQATSYLTSRLAQDRTGLSAPTAHSAIDTLFQFGVRTEITGRRRKRVFA